ncbi:MAG: sugar nucleotide-binding protein [Chloroflexota bacterium]|nr:sugar nucleotide-binding protein [Chloroflexota bacterium]
METTPRSTPLELWGGIECTVNRVGDEYFDQLQQSGHDARGDDLERFAALGIRTLRYPVLWERTAPDGPAHADWAWADERLGRLRELGIRPIVGLVHHGSGPRHTDLTQRSFAEGLAEYARAVATRYPWVEDFTPVNEPLTTARFSGLYGIWYPHGCDARSFARALLTQCRAVVLAMSAIRQVTPTARLVQTEDLGKTFSTPSLARQAAFENERRWLTFDLLCGRVTPSHRMWSYLRVAGIPEPEIAWFLERPCPPDLLGVNYYITGERFLDERMDAYPPHTHGGNGRRAYADLEAVRVCVEGIAGPQALLAEAWERYRLPIAVTETQLNCTREEQLRWLRQAWQSAHAARRDGADVRAVTVWALLGASGWDGLLRRPPGRYEVGAFDVRGPYPRPTALAAMARSLASGEEYDHPALSGPGWWRRPSRFIYHPVRAHRPPSPAESEADRPSNGEEDAVVERRPIVVTGAGTAFAYAFARLCDMRGLTCRLLGARDVDLADASSVDAMLDHLNPWAVVNAVDYAHVDAAERDPEACYRANTTGPAVLAAACAPRGVALLTFSSDLVFDGRRDAPYVESDPVAPLGVYGRSKAEAEARVLRAYPAALVVRTGPLFGPWEDDDFVTVAVRHLASGRRVVLADDAVTSPTYVPDLVHAALDLLVDGERGLWHLANPGAATRVALVQRAAELAGVDAKGLEGRPTRVLERGAPRLPHRVLGSERGVHLFPLDTAVESFVHDRRIALAAAIRPAA